MELQRRSVQRGGIQTRGGFPVFTRCRRILSTWAGSVACRGVLRKALALARPGVTASEVYKGAVADLPASLSKHFMGYGDSGVKFLGHGLGLHIDEYPVIMAANESPLAAGMVIALEPKCGVEGVGMAGVEESYVIEESGPRCLTGGDRSIVRV